MLSGRLPAALAFAAAAVGAAISVYLTAVHYAGAPLACSASGTINCEAVLTSGYGRVFGSTVPTSAAGMAWFGISGAIAAAQMARRGGAAAVWAHRFWAGAGLAVVLSLVYFEVVRIGAICAWCTGVHALVLATAVLTAYEAPPD